jgi:hypothetical protein
MTLNASGNLLVGTTNTYYANNLIVSAGSEGGITIANPSTTGAQYLMFADGTTGSDRFRGYMAYNHTDDSMSFATNAAIKFTIASTGAATFSNSVSVVGLNLTSTYASKIGLYNSSSAANMELGTNTSTNGAIVSRLTSYNTNNGNSGNESSSNFMGIVSLETQLQGTNGGNFILKTKGDGGTLDTKLTIASTGAATFSSSVTATGGTASYSTSALPTATISTTTTGAINAAYTSIRIGARGQSGQDQSIAITNVPTADGNSAIAFTTMDSYSYAERLRITSGGNVEIATGSIKTGEPDTGYGRAAFKIGTRQSGTAFDAGGYIPVSIDGTVYFINLFTSTP